MLSANLPNIRRKQTFAHEFTASLIIYRENINFVVVISLCCCRTSVNFIKLICSNIIRPVHGAAIGRLMKNDTALGENSDNKHSQPPFATLDVQRSALACHHSFSHSPVYLLVCITHINSREHTSGTDPWGTTKVALNWWCFWSGFPAAMPAACGGDGVTRAVARDRQRRASRWLDLHRQRERPFAKACAMSWGRHAASVATTASHAPRHCHGARTATRRPALVPRSGHSRMRHQFHFRASNLVLFWQKQAWILHELPY